MRGSIQPIRAGWRDVNTDGKQSNTLRLVQGGISKGGKLSHKGSMGGDRGKLIIVIICEKRKRGLTTRVAHPYD